MKTVPLHFCTGLVVWEWFKRCWFKSALIYPGVEMWSIYWMAPFVESELKWWDCLFFAFFLLPCMVTNVLSLSLQHVVVKVCLSILNLSPF